MTKQQEQVQQVPEEINNEQPLFTIIPRGTWRVEGKTSKLTLPNVIKEALRGLRNDNLLTMKEVEFLKQIGAKGKKIYPQHINKLFKREMNQVFTISKHGENVAFGLPQPPEE